MASVAPCLAKTVVLYSPLSTPALGPPPAMPQGPKVGARPGARQGLNLVQSAAEPATAPRFVVRCLAVGRGAIYSGTARNIPFAILHTKYTKRRPEWPYSPPWLAVPRVVVRRVDAVAGAAAPADAVHAPVAGAAAVAVTALAADGAAGREPCAQVAPAVSRAFPTVSPLFLARHR